LTVARHVRDLHDVLAAHCPHARPAIVGHSWGAMLALAYAATHCDEVGPIVLVASGTFDEASRRRFVELREARTTPEMRRALEAIDREALDPGPRFAKRFAVTRAVEEVAPVDDDDDARDDFDPMTMDRRAHSETWSDMLRLLRDGTHPAAFAAIRSPALMLHGDYDPHPGEMIHASLASHIPQLEYREIARCGHYPWRERDARGPFFHALNEWLELQSKAL
jgi:pimeloyl-ACP methyl ester carboxylesterase